MGESNHNSVSLFSNLLAKLLNKMYPIPFLNSIPLVLIPSEASSLTITLLTKQYSSGVYVVLKLLFIHLFITALFQTVN